MQKEKHVTKELTPTDKLSLPIPHHLTLHPQSNALCPLARKVKV